MSRINLDFQELAAFIEVAECASFRAAAERLHLSPPALSRRIDKLERTLGVRLLERTTRRVTLTPAGRRFVGEAREALHALERAALGLQETSGLHGGMVTIACVPTTTFTLVPDMLHQFVERLPGVRFRLLDASEGEVEQLVLSGEADFGIGFPSEATADLGFVPLVQDPYVLALRRGHPLAHRKRLRGSDLAGQRLITVSRASGNRPYVERVLEAADARLEPFIEVSRVSTVLSLVEAGLGIGLLPRMALPAQHPQLVGIELAGAPVRRSIGLLLRHGAALKPLPRMAFDMIVETVGARAGVSRAK